MWDPILDPIWDPAASHFVENHSYQLGPGAKEYVFCAWSSASSESLKANLDSYEMQSPMPTVAGQSHLGSGRIAKGKMSAAYWADKVKW